MKITNSKTHYGLISVSLHWIIALIIFFLFGIGVYMVTLGYYDSGYHTWPQYHKSFGIIVFALLIIRLIWLLINQKPAANPNHKTWEVKIAHLTHGLLYLLVICICITGYLISTAEGDPIAVFNWFNIPAVIEVGKYSDQIGVIHKYLAYTLAGLVILHAVGAIKHQIIDKDNTLLRIFGK